MYTCAKFHEDKQGNLSGSLCWDDATADIRIVNHDDAHGAGHGYHAFLNNGFIGDFESRQAAMDWVLYRANMQHDAGTLTMQ